MILYRLEDKDGKGPFTGSDRTLYTLDKSYMTLKYPNAWSDMSVYPSSDEVHAVKDRRLLRYWFPKWVRHELKAAGYRVALYIADDSQVRHGKYQTLVKKDAKKVTKWTN